MGVVGFGRIGREVAARLEGVQVQGPGLRSGRGRRGRLRPPACTPASLDELLRTSDLVTLHCPSNDQTKYMINAQSIATMKPGVMLVNTSRGTLVKTDDLAAALRSGRISAAALDVTDPEPIPPDHPLVKMDNVIITAHIASASPRAVQKLRTTAANIGGARLPRPKTAQHRQRRERLGVHHGSRARQTFRLPSSEQFCQTALGKCGLSEADARVATDVLVTTDTFGVFTHGVKSLPGYVRRLRGGGLRADAVPRVERQGPAWAIVDGQSAIGMVTSVFAMNTAIEKARAAGVAYVGVRNSCHFGAAGYYALLAAKAGMFGMAMANDTPSMVVPGARKAVLGTNPFAYAVPAGQEDPIFLDIASSAVAGGKIRVFQGLGQKVPDSWLVDTEGVPTTDPFAYPFAGALQPFAGHKGYGIALMIETLAGVLSGAAIRGDIRGWIDSDPTLPTRHGAAFLAIDVDQMMPVGAFQERVDAMIRDIRQTPKAKGAERIFLPGEMEWQKRREALANGIALPEDVRAGLRELAKEIGIEVDWLSE